MGATLGHISRNQVRIVLDELGSTTIPIAFTEYMASGMAILGRQGFFEAHEITFREWEKKASNQSKEHRTVIQD